jgi:hypothetical protein
MGALGTRSALSRDPGAVPLLGRPFGAEERQHDEEDDLRQSGRQARPAPWRTSL